jgi:hypothetical protein
MEGERKKDKRRRMYVECVTYIYYQWDRNFTALKVLVLHPVVIKTYIYTHIGFSLMLPEFLKSISSLERSPGFDSWTFY